MGICTQICPTSVYVFVISGGQTCRSYANCGLMPCEIAHICRYIRYIPSYLSMNHLREYKPSSLFNIRCLGVIFNMALIDMRHVDASVIPALIIILSVFSYAYLPYLDMLSLSPSILS